MSSALKTIVSKKKRRFVKDGYNLDLTYINDRIIAMGFPSENFEALYRNSLEEVKRFLDKKHKDHYRIYNLCSERDYDANKFHGRVVHFPFDDHNPPNFNIIRLFCQDVEDWLAQHSQNVCAVHCKAGKGRTGVMICCYLLHTRDYPTANEVLDYYGRVRTIDHKGVTIPSQRRYISYYADLLGGSYSYHPSELYLTSVVLDPAPNFLMPVPAEFQIHIEVHQMDSNSVDSTTQRIFESKAVNFKRTDRRVCLSIPPLLLRGDVKIEFHSRHRLDKMGIKTKKEFHFWINTFFAQKPFDNALSHFVLEEEEEESMSNGNLRHSNSSTSKTKAATLLPVTDLSNLLKCASISDDYLLSTDNVTHGVVSHSTSSPMNSSSSSSSTSSSCSSTCNNNNQSFSDKRIRHSSVPQTSPASSHFSSHHHHNRSNNLLPPGKKIILSLNKLQLDKIVKDKSSKVYDENFTVALTLIQPPPKSSSWIPPSFSSSSTPTPPPIGGIGGIGGGGGSCGGSGGVGVIGSSASSSPESSSTEEDSDNVVASTVTVDEEEEEEEEEEEVTPPPPPISQSTWI